MSAGSDIRSSPITAADIDDAARRIADVVLRSPLQHSDRLSEATGAQVYLKREDLQTVRSYKVRGAYNLLKQLTDEELRAGWCARRPATMPRFRTGLPHDAGARPRLRPGQDTQAETGPNPLPRRRLHRTHRRRSYLRRRGLLLSRRRGLRTGATLVPPL